MRKVLIAVILGLSLVACEKEKANAPASSPDASVDQSSSDAVSVPDVVTPSGDVTASADVTPATATDAVAAD